VTVPAADHAAPGVEARSLYRFFRAGEEETLALRGVSMRVEGGEVVAVVGPSGSGKSTLLACLAGLDEPDGGTVLVGGRRISHRPESTRTALRAGRVGLLFQSGNLFDHLTVAQNVALVQQLSGRMAVVPRSEQTSRRLELISAVGIADRASAYPGEHSGGQLARAGLAVALANDPAVLLADEPTGELDSATETQILWMLTAAAEKGTAVLVASHSPRVAAIAHRTVRLEDGKVA
jgi:putative ABC transport system ATP-binding protein